ncbi:MAG: hypothetical protein AB4426_10650 [Xenococcaceae cyanobacterium]
MITIPFGMIQKQAILGNISKRELECYLDLNHAIIVGWALPTKNL